MTKSTSKKRQRSAQTVIEEDTDAEQQSTHPSKKARVEPNKSLFVRNLPSNATSESLTEFVSLHYPVKHSVVVLDPKSKTSRGYGFVTFTDPDDATEAKEKLAKEAYEGRLLRLDWAEARVRNEAKDLASTVHSRVAEEKRKRQEALDEARKPPKLIIRNLPWSIKTSEQLAALFRSYGKVKFADLPQDKGKLKGFGFVTLRRRKNAEKALEGVNGKVVDGRPVAVDWAVEKGEWEKQEKEDTQGDEEVQDKAKKTSSSAQEKEDAQGDEEVREKAKKEAKKTASSAQEKDDEMEEEDADLAAFMQNHMEHMEDEEESDAEQDDETTKGSDAEYDDDRVSWEGDGASNETAKKKPLQTDNSTTLFVRNLPYTVTDEQLKTHFGTFGRVRYARVVMDRSTDRSAGTGFVCFAKLEDSQACLRGAPRQRPTNILSKQSVLQDETVDPEGKYTLGGRVLQLAQAVTKDEASRLLATGPARKGQDKDKRRLYLLSEGTIPKGSPLYHMLTPSEVKMRQDSEKQRKKQIQSNPSLHLSLTRLAVRNIPRNFGSKELKALAREAVVGFAKDVKEGRRQALSKEEVNRTSPEEREKERLRKAKGKGIVRQAKIVFETKQGTKVAEETGAGKSRGYGFIEYSSHRWALMGLRFLNGSALKNEAGKSQRLIVEFAIENANVVQRRRAAEGKSGRAPRAHEQAQDGDAGKDASSSPEEDKPKTSKKSKKSKGEGKKGKKGDKERAAAAGKGDRTHKGAKDGEEDGDGDTKLALRTKIIARKRMMRKKKASFRAKK